MGLEMSLDLPANSSLASCLYSWIVAPTFVAAIHPMWPIKNANGEATTCDALPSIRLTAAIIDNDLRFIVASLTVIV